MTEKEYCLIIKQHSNSVYHFIAKNIGDTEVAKDIVQDSFQNLWLKRDNINYETSKSYLFKTAYNTMLNVIKHRKIRENYEYEEVEYKENNDLKDLINCAMNRLSEKQRTILMLRDYEGYNYEEITNILDISLEQVKINIFRARIKLREIIENLDK